MTWFYNFKISIKLLSSFIFVASIAAFVGFMGFNGINKMDKAITEIGVVRLPSIQALLTISEAQTAVKAAERTILNSNLTKDERIKEYENIKNAFKRADENWKIYEPLPQTVEEAKLWKEFIPAWDKWKSDDAEFLKLSSELDMLGTSNTDTVRSMYEKMNKQALEVNKTSFDEAEALLNNIVTINQEEGTKANKAADEAVASATTILLITIVIGFFSAVGLGIFISRIISKPLKELVGVAGKIASGDLNANVEVKTKDEVGTLAQAFDAMVNNINEVMSDINASSEQVAAGSRQVSASGQALSQGSTEQASSIEEITSSMTQVAAQTKQNAVNANQANELATSAKENAVQGNSQMQEMVKAMAEINDSSANISKIIKVIDEIAFQTNILALNAAVEAARAGQHGKGFAVVAEEVRNLAARSANAAKETTDMIEGSIKKVEAGTKIANETAGALNKIVEGVAKAAALVGDIASASNEQATGIAQVNQAIAQVAQVVQTNSATAEESASASEELSSQAQLLKEAVSKFKLKKVKNTSTSSLDSLSPDIMRMIEDAVEKKKTLHTEHIKTAMAEAVTASKAHISLENKDYGKY